jgi:hypothetical protein
MGELCLLEYDCLFSPYDIRAGILNLKMDGCFLFYSYVYNFALDYTERLIVLFNF